MEYKWRTGDIEGHAFYHLTEKQRAAFKSVGAQVQKEKLLHPFIRQWVQSNK